MSEARIDRIDGLDGTDDPRRQLPIEIMWSAGLVGRITVGGEYWGEVEWSERRQAWCIEDVTGACLTHASGIHGKAASKEGAVALAREMIIDGRMPSPEQAHEAWRAGEPERERQREKRRQQPAAIRRREAARARHEAAKTAWMAQFRAEQLDRAQPPLEEVLAEVFDFTDPELWKSSRGDAAAAADPASACGHRQARMRARRHVNRDVQAVNRAGLDRAREILRALESTADAVLMLGKPSPPTNIL
jgi:hypothetical protein